MRWITFLVLLLIAGSLQAAQVLSVDTFPNNADGTFDAGSTITIRVRFDSTVTLAPNTDPKLLLSVGRPPGDDAYAYAAAGQSDQDINFVYVVRAGDNSADLDYASANALTDVTDMSGNLPAPGSFGSLGYNAMVVIDTAPLVRAVTTTLGTGTYGIGQIIPVTVIFSEPVFLSTGASANVTLQLSSTTATANLAATSGSGTSQLQFAYTVLSGETVTGLDYASTTALSLTGTLKDKVSVGNTATLTLPAGGSAKLQAINIDATPPNVVSITSIAANGSYKIGDSIPITVQFSEAVTVTGSPTLSLDTTGTATYLSGSGTTNLTFTYVVGASQISSDLDVVSLDTTSSSIVDSIGNPRSTPVPTGTDTGALAKNKAIRIAVPATITSASITSTSTPTPITTGGTATIKITFSGTPTITGSGATLNLETGTTDRDAVFSSISGSDIIFTYTVQAGDNTAKLDYTSINALNIGGVVVDGFTGMSFALPALGGGSSLAASNIQVDTTPAPLAAPTFTLTPSIAASSTAPIAVGIAASEPVTGFDQTDLTCTKCTATLSGSSPSFSASLTPISSLYAGVSASSGSSVIRLKARSGTIPLTANMPLRIGSATFFVATAVSVTTALTDVTLTSALSAGLAANADVWLPTGETMSLSIPANAAKDLAGNNSTVSSTASIVYDPTPPIAMVTAPANFASPLVFTIDFSENVDTLTASGLTTSNGNLGTLTSITAKQWTVAVTPIASGNVGLQVKSNVVLDQASNPNPTSTMTLFVPIAVIQIATNPTTPRACKVGDVIDLIVTLNQTATFTPGGSPATLLLETGVTDHPASLILPAASGLTDTLTFRYTVVAGDSTSDLDVTSGSALNLQGGSLNNVTSLTVPTPGASGSLSTTSAVTIDTVNPTFTLTPAALVSTAAPVTVTMVASEPVTGFILSDLTCTNCTATLTGSSPNFSASLTPASTLYAGSAASAGSSVIRLKARSGTIPLIANQPLQIGLTTVIVASDVTVPATGTGIDVTLKSALASSLSTNADVWLPTGETMSLNIPANAAQDLAGNNSTVSSTPSIVYDPTPPIATVTAPANYGSPLSFMIDFSENVSALTGSALTVTNGTLGTLNQINPKKWTVAVTPIASGNVGLQVKSNVVVDQASNPNPASAIALFTPLAVTQIATNPVSPRVCGVGDVIDLIVTLNRTVAFAPSPTPATLLLETGAIDHPATLVLPAAGQTNTLTFRYTVVAGDTTSDLDVTSTSALNLQGGTIDSLTTLTVPAPGAAGSVSATSAVSIDTLKPDVTLDTPIVTGWLQAVMTMNFSEAIDPSTLTMADFTLPAGVSIRSIAIPTSNRIATVTFDLPTPTTPIAVYPLQFSGSVSDPVNNVSTVTPSTTITYDSRIPVLTLSGPPGDQAATPLAVTISSSKYVTGMATDDCNVTNGVASSISNAIGTSFIASVTPTAPMRLGQSAAAGVNSIRLQAVSGDVMVAAGTVLRVVDSGVATTVRLSTTSATTVTSAGVTVGIDGVLPAAVASGAVVWQANGVLVTMSVRANACTDQIGQGNSVTAIPVAVRYDPTNPMFRIAAPATLAADGTAVFTLTPSEPVSGLTASKLTTDGVVQSVTESADRLTWAVAVTPVGSTSVSLAIAGNAATDGAGNPSLAEAAVVFSIKPQIIKVSADNADGTYTPGTRLRLRVTFSENVQVSGVPDLSLNLTPGGRSALYASGTGSKELLFDYTIVQGDATTDLDYTSGSALTLPNGAVIADVDSGNNATLTLAAPGEVGSIAASSAIVVNDGGASGPGKPGIGDQPAGSGGCGAGSGIALILVGGWLGMSLGLRRRRRAA